MFKPEISSFHSPLRNTTNTYNCFKQENKLGSNPRSVNKIYCVSPSMASCVTSQHHHKNSKQALSVSTSQTNAFQFGSLSIENSTLNKDSQCSYLYRTESKSLHNSQAEEIIQKLKGDVDCWEIRYKCLEKQYSSMLAQEYQISQKGKDLMEQQLHVQIEKSEQQILTKRMEEKIMQLDKENFKLQEQISQMLLQQENKSNQIQIESQSQDEYRTNSDSTNQNQALKLIIDQQKSEIEMILRREKYKFK